MMLSALIAIVLGFLFGLLLWAIRGVAERLWRDED